MKNHFSDPQNCGGTVTNVLYPLPHRSAVVYFKNPADVDKVLQTSHELEGESLTLMALPQNVYSRVSTVVDKTASVFIRSHRDIVPELEYAGGLSVSYSSEQESYTLMGTWYQLEWALYFLDSRLSAYGVDITATSSSNNLTEQQSRKYFTRPNSDRKQLDSETFRGEKPTTKLQSLNPENYLKRPEVKKPIKNKNEMPTKMLNYKEPPLVCAVGPERAAYVKPPSYHTAEKMPSFDDWKQFNTTGNKPFMFKGTGGGATNFEENPPRLSRPHHAMTSGLDIAMADFGDVPMTFDFDVGRDLRVSVLKGDIIKQKTDAIVNPTSKNMLSQSALSRAIMTAISADEQKECVKYVEENGELETAEVMHTVAGGTLQPNVSAVLHVCAPSWSEENSEAATHLLVCTYLSCFMYADIKLWQKSLATPLISAGAFGYPLDVCLQAFFDALLLFSRRHTEKHHLQAISLICFDVDSVMASISILQSLLDCDHATSAVAASERYNLLSLTTNCSVSGFRIAMKNAYKESEQSKSKADNDPKSSAKNVKDADQEPTGSKADHKEHMLTRTLQKKVDNYDDSDDDSIENHSSDENRNESFKEKGITTKRMSPDYSSNDDDDDKYERNSRKTGDFRHSLKPDDDDDELEYKGRKVVETEKGDDYDSFEEKQKDVDNRADDDFSGRDSEEERPETTSLDRGENVAIKQDTKKEIEYSDEDIDVYHKSEKDQCEVKQKDGNNRADDDFSDRDSEEEQLKTTSLDRENMASKKDAKKEIEFSDEEIAVEHKSVEGQRELDEGQREAGEDPRYESYEQEDFVTSLLSQPFKQAVVSVSEERDIPRAGGQADSVKSENQKEISLNGKTLSDWSFIERREVLRNSDDEEEEEEEEEEET